MTLDTRPVWITRAEAEAIRKSVAWHAAPADVTEAVAAAIQSCWRELDAAPAAVLRALGMPDADAHGDSA